MLYKITAYCPQNNLDCYNNILTDLLKEPTKSWCASTVFLFNSVVVLGLSEKSEKRLGSSATGAIVTGYLIPLSMLYYFMVLFVISGPKWYAYNTKINDHSDEIKNLIETIQNKKVQYPLFCSLAGTQAISFLFELTRFIVFLTHEHNKNISENKTEIEQDVEQCNINNYLNDFCIAKAQIAVSFVALVCWLSIIGINSKNSYDVYKHTNRSDDPIKFDRAIFQLLNNVVFIIRTGCRLARLFIINNNLSIFAAKLEISRNVLNLLVTKIIDAKEANPSETSYLSALIEEITKRFQKNDHKYAAVPIDELQ